MKRDALAAMLSPPSRLRMQAGIVAVSSGEAGQSQRRQESRMGLTTWTFAVGVSALPVQSPQFGSMAASEEKVLTLPSEP